jgi:hypothetical protein
LNFELVLIGERNEDGSIKINIISKETRIILRANGVFIADITDLIKPSFKTNFTHDGAKSDFELISGEEFKGINTVFDYECL